MMPTTPFFVGDKGNVPGLTVVLLGTIFLLAVAVVYLIVKQHRLHRLSKKQSSLHPNHRRRR